MPINKTLINKKTMGKVAVVMGGNSAEREISLLSGNAILKALLNKNIDAYKIDASDNLIKQLTDGGFKKVFVALHGRGGEDGTLQGLLEMMNIAYTGTGVAGSAIAMDKLKTKQIWNALNLPTPDYLIIKSAEDLLSAVNKLGLPVIVKPVLEGSSIGMSMVEDKSQVKAAWLKAKHCGGTVIAERWIDGKEYTVSILGKQTLPLIELKTPHKFYDYDAKYHAEDTEYIFPHDMSEQEKNKLNELSKKAFLAVGASTWGRVDLMMDKNKKPWLIEVNTVPGMTSHSLVPMAALKAGISFDDLVLTILSDASCHKTKQQIN